jgi:L-lactate utilization protein LutB
MEDPKAVALISQVLLDPARPEGLRVQAALALGEIDGPEQVHLIILDNGRTSLLADPQLREALFCIRCGACLNTCPVYQRIGGHAYGATYPGPIGSVITPLLKGLEAAPDLIIPVHNSYPDK